MVPPRKRARLVSSETPNDSEFKQVSNLEEYRMKDMLDSDVYYVSSFASKEISDDWYTALLELDSWYQPKLKVYGREVTQSRKIAAYSTDPNLTLKYSGQIVDMRYPYPPLLRDIQDQVEKRLGVKFNHVLLNLYEDGAVYIGNHRDNIENKVVASLSLGAPRIFNMIHDNWKSKKAKSAAVPSHQSHSNEGPSMLRKRPTENDGQVDSSSNAIPVYRKSWTLNSGSLVVMQGVTQKHWKHEIPKEAKVTKGRISLTFRQLVNS